jgi:pimeloyl-ACP methyl ester carboxylesterase
LTAPETPGEPPAAAPLRRRIIQSCGRSVHLWTGGEGPALILIHGSPGNAWLVLPLARSLARHYCVYAVDTPGFGGSDGLPGSVGSVAQLADAYRDFLDSIGLANVLVYGTHSGAAIGLELAHRHPARVTGFVLEGVPIFTLEEQRPLLAPEYLAAFEPEILGGHYARAWTRFRDQFVWFPWYVREPSHLNEACAGSAADIHLWVEMYFQASRHDYRPAYRAVIRYGSAALDAARDTRVPGVYLAERSDMLFPHLDRLPELHDGQRVERILEPSEVPACIAAALASLPASAHGKVLDAAGAAHKPGFHEPGIREPRFPEFAFHDFPGGQMLVRARLRGAGTPVLLLHDAPGAGRGLMDLYLAFDGRAPVLLPDLPGCGESDPLPEDACGVGDFADAVARVIAARCGRAVHVHAVGFGAAVALELNARHPRMIASLTLTGVLRTVGDARRDMLGRLAPPIELADDGSHWYRTWLMLRDSLVRWPWYAREPAALRRQPIALEPGHLHAWTCDVMRQWHSYHRLIDAVLAWNPEPAIALGGEKLTVAVDSRHALHAADLAWAENHRAVTLPEDPADRARALAAVIP